MVSVLSSTKSPRVLIGRIGSNGPFNRIAEGLRNSGYRVTEWESSRIGVHSTEQDVREQVKDIDIAFLVIRAEDANDRGGAIRPLQRILVQAGLMQGKMRMDRVVLLVEETVRGLSADTGLGIIRFSPEDPEGVLNAVIGKIDELFPEEPEEWVAEPTTRIANLPPPPEHRSRPAITPTAQPRGLGGDEDQSDALKVALRLVLLVVLAALFSVLLAFLLANRGGDENDDAAADADVDVEQLEESTTTSQNFVETDADAGSVDEATGGIRLPSAPEAATELLEDVGVGQLGIDSPAAPEAVEDGSASSLPATCQVNLRKGSLLDDAIQCDGAGRLEVSGHEGPWHNDTAAVVMGEGVVGVLEFELRDDGTTVGPSVLELPVGTTVLNDADARFGIGTLILKFSGNGQHVHFFGQGDAEGLDATLRFNLDG